MSLVTRDSRSGQAAAAADVDLDCLWNLPAVSFLSHH